MAQLQVNVIEGKNLKQKDRFSGNDAFIEIYLDNIHQKQKTKVKQNSNNPIWNESFVFNHLQDQHILHINIYDEDTIKNEKIGSLQIDLHRLYDNGHIDDWFNIEDKHGIQSQGQIHLSLHYEKLKI
ncbi:unnamed protein product [Rotaria sp. Silwood1]|nr:unnamed protein product [Rotaria sp. Silwood1]CAF1661831.1 unnamed protein product [Rotaria sp. Silwood1]CAF4032751.1 unnamed protein product [Rotaria sp. Silwood1]CAF5044684.1 unnamed protein product [Rotaria sp. Silwood1]